MKFKFDSEFFVCLRGPRLLKKFDFSFFCSRFKEQILVGSSGLVIFASEVDVVGGKKKKVAGRRFFRFFLDLKTRFIGNGRKMKYPVAKRSVEQC